MIYDEDERIASSAATVFVQRGIDNVFMLSGGLIVCVFYAHVESMELDVVICVTMSVFFLQLLILLLLAFD